MSDSTKPSNGNSITLRPTHGPSCDSEKDLAFLEWIHDQLTVLAEAFGEPLTQERAEIYVGSLASIPGDRLRVAFARALNESTFFPKVAELRSRAGASTEDEKKVEAHAAWNHVNEYLRKWGVDKLPIRSRGQWITAPPLEPRLEYAVRQIGGLWRLNQVTDENYAFVLRDFCEAYALAPIAELMSPQLLEQFADRKLLGSVKKTLELSGNKDSVGQRDSENAAQLPGENKQVLIGGLTAERNAEPRTQLDKEQPRTIVEEAADRNGAGVPRELTPGRKAELRRQLGEELAKRGIARSAAGLD
jgi:hypothetical protein